MAKKKKKEAVEGNLLASAVLGAITAAIGMVLGICSLALVPVTEVREMPNEESTKPNTVYFVMGQDRGDYKVQERDFLQRKPGQTTFTEADLNRWAGDSFKFSKPTPEEEASAGMITMRPSAPNFRIADGIMQIGLNVEMKAFGEQFKMRYFTTGYFVPSGAGYAFQPVESHLGSGRLPPAVVAPFFAETLFGVFQNTEQYPVLHEAWISLSNVSLEGNKLVLTR